MTPSAQEIEDGRKAYRRIEVFARNRWTSFNFGFVILFLAIGIWSDYKNHGPERAAIAAAIWIVLISLGCRQYQGQKKRNQKDLLLLKALKAKYGEAIYREIEKEPRSLYYYLCQKRYAPGNRQTVALP